jgi:hypothetical protein
MANNIFYTGCKVIIDNCSECGNPIPLDKIVESVECISCGTKHNIPSYFWSSGFFILKSASLLDSSKIEEDFSGMQSNRKINFGSTFAQFRHAKMEPKCYHCSEILYINEDAIGDGDYTCHCKKCNGDIYFETPPDWLKEILPNISHIAKREKDEKGKSLPLSDEKGDVVHLDCPSCSGNLKITATNERLTECEYCNNSFYIPKEIWQKLHPVKKTEITYIRNKITPESYRKSVKGFIIGMFFVSMFFLGMIAAAWAVAFDASKGGKIKFIYYFGVTGTLVFGIPCLLILNRMMKKVIRYLKKAKENN